ncbi:hypothetical protein J2S40_004370 [Nocardioides luteus]|uniref:DUF3592 domain-containing protein n=1 Tax=Nocardioides luteus TaxID=1844 RepID=UPI00188B641A|nr:DUF3592 domain-containing protein [Nocardioides luteus]MDR7313312.1 hypothetical protein [Nocardioides luteus]
MLVALAGAAVAAAGFLNLPSALHRARSSRTWARTTARITKAWKENISGQPGNTRHHVNYTFVAPETGGSYYGHSEGGAPGMKTGDEIGVMYDPAGPHDNELPLNRFERCFYPFVFSFLALFGVALSLCGLIAAIVMIAS